MIAVAEDGSEALGALVEASPRMGVVWVLGEGEPAPEGLFFGEYMSQYSWAEGTLANLTMFAMR